jgi:hypothetical protein
VRSSSPLYHRSSVNRSLRERARQPAETPSQTSRGFGFSADTPRRDPGASFPAEGVWRYRSARAFAGGLRSCADSPEHPLVWGLGRIVPSPGPHHRSWRSPGEVEKLPRLNPVGASCHSGAGSSRRLASLSRLAIGNERRTEGHNASRFAAEREMIRCCCGGARPSRGRSGAGVSSARSGSTRAASARWSHTGREDNEVSVSGDRFEATLVQNRSIPGDLRLKRKRSREPNVALGTTRVRCSLRSCRGFRVGRQKVVRGSIPLTAPV